MRRRAKAPSVGPISSGRDCHGLTTPSRFLLTFAVSAVFVGTALTPAIAGAAQAPITETTGSPVRTTTMAQLNGRLVAFGEPTTYHFEYGLTAAYGQSTTSRSGGSGVTYQMVTEEVTGLAPNTTYHYRLVADNGAPGSPVSGEDMTVTTRASNMALTHGHFPGPVGSDRAWELVSQPDTSGNPVFAATAISDDGNRVVYQVKGGAPHSESGSLGTQLFTERTPSGWQTRGIYPPRAETHGPIWQEPTAKADLSAMVAVNYSFTGEEASGWRMFPDRAAEKIFSFPANEWGSVAMSSEDTSRVVWVLIGSHDPAHPSLPGVEQLYDVSSGTPHLISLMPDGSVPSCGVSGYLAIIQATQRRNWVTPDGSFAFFQSCGRLFARDINGEATHKLSGPALSGEECGGTFIKSTPGAVFFTTATRLVAEDTPPPSCTADNDVYRYELASESLNCVTCVVPGLDANVLGTDNSKVGVSASGSSVYFNSRSQLTPGATSEGIYRVAVSTGDLDYISSPAQVGDESALSNAVSADGTVLIFKSESPDLNALGGQNNGGTAQYYRYDADDRSLICVSCPEDGSLPVASVNGARGGGLLASNMQLGPNTEPLDAKGDFIFVTPTSLAFADQNTSEANPYTGHDVYEWRDGRQLLISDGLTNWARDPFSGEIEGPEPMGFTPSGRDAFFTAPAQYTRDALDGFRRVYDARIGGGFDFPPPPPPCPLEVCQGIPKGAPEEQASGTSAFSGAGNSKAKPAAHRCVKGKRRARHNGRSRCVKQKGRSQRRANHNGRTAR